MLSRFGAYVVVFFSLALASWSLVASAQVAAPPAAPSGTLAQRLAAGQPYVLITRRQLFPRASQGTDDWFAISGYYRSEDGTWTSNAIGFPTPGTPWHACPSGAECGGIHEPGLTLERRFRPEDNEMVVIGQRLTFDAEGRVFSSGRQIGFVMTPGLE